MAVSYLKRFYVLLTAACAAGLVLSYTGWFFAPGDSFAVFRLPLILLVLPGLFIKSKWLQICLLILLVFSIGTAAAHQFGKETLDPSAATFGVYQKNMRFSNPDPEPIATDISNLRADFVSLQEVKSQNNRIFDILAEDYPSRHRCERYGVGAYAVLSRFPVIPGSKKCLEGAAMMRVETPQGPVWMISVHLHWPWPHDQFQQTKRLAEHIQALDGPILTGGDFNAVAWSAALRRFERAVDGKRVDTDEPTFNLPMFSMPVTIDHIIGAEGSASQTTVRPKLGSDHHGIFTMVAPSRKATREKQ